MGNLFLKLRRIFKAAISIFAFLVLFQITPNSHAIFHTLIHDHGIIHTHSDAGEDHSQEDHQTGKVHDLYFDAVSVTLQSHARLVSGLFIESFFICWTNAWEIPLKYDPPGLALDRFDKIPKPSFLTEARASHLLRAPPSA